MCDGNNQNCGGLWSALDDWGVRMALMRSRIRARESAAELLDTGATWDDTAKEESWEEEAKPIR